MCTCDQGYKLFVLQSFADIFTAKVIVRYCEHGLILMIAMMTSMIRTMEKR